MFDFADGATKFLGRPWRLPITGSDRLVSYLCTLTSFIVYSEWIAINMEIDLLASDCIFHLIAAASGFPNHLHICILGHICAGCIGRVAVDTGICIAAVSHRVVDCIKRQSFGSIQIHSDLAVVIVGPWPSVVGMVWKTTTKWSGKSCGMYSYLQVKIEWVTPNLNVLLKRNPTEFSCRLQGFPTYTWFAASRSDVVYLISGIHCSEQRLKSHKWLIYTVHSSMEKTSGDVSLKTSLEFAIEQMLIVKSRCIVSITIHNEVTVKMQIVLGSSWSYVPKLT